MSNTVNNNLQTTPTSQAQTPMQSHSLHQHQQQQITVSQPMGCKDKEQLLS